MLAADRRLFVAERHDWVDTNRPPGRQAGSCQGNLMNAFSETLDELRSVKPGAVILTGTGSAFSAGVDLPRLLDGGPDYVNKFIPALCDSVQKLFTFPR